MTLSKAQEESVRWAEECIDGNKRGNGERDHIKNLLEIINEQFAEIELLEGKRE